MIKAFLTNLLIKIESKMSHQFKETVFRNVYLYPVAIFILQLPILMTNHIFYTVVLAPVAILSLFGYLISLKKRVICQIEYPMMLFFTVLLTLISYISYFINKDVYSFIFVLLSAVGIITVMDMFMMYTGNAKTVLKHYALPKFLDGYDKQDLEILGKILNNEQIIARHLFITLKDMYRNYLPTAGLYIGIDFTIKGINSFGDYRIADNYNLVNSYSLLSLVQHIKETDVDVKSLSRDDFEVFKMNVY